MFCGIRKDTYICNVIDHRECQPSHSKADRRESGDSKRFGLDRYPPQLDKLSYRTLRFSGGSIFIQYETAFSIKIFDIRG